MTAAQLSQMLRERLPAEQWALFFEVRNGTGFSRRVTRTADAIAMSLWPSRGLELHGFEIKVSRSDWQRELADPSKAESIQRFCDRWWVVVSDPEIVQAGELPPTWGLMAPRGSKLVVRTEAPKLEAQPIDRLFLAAMLRAATQSSEDQLNARVTQAVEPHVEKKRNELEAAAKRYDDLSASLLADFRAKGQQFQKTIEEFEQASGVRIEGWRAGLIGEAVRAVLNNGADAALAELRRARERTARVLEVLDEQLTAVQRPGSEVPR